VPFTVSHAAAALPFLRTPLVPAALVIGTVAPDLPYFTPLPGVIRGLTHSPLGVVTIDLAIGGLVLALWWLALRAPVLDLSPVWLRNRMPTRSAFSLRLVVLAAVSLMVGAATHLVWDSFTHLGPVVNAIPVLGATYGPLLLHKWLQHASSIVGLVVLGVWVARWVRRVPVHPVFSPSGEWMRRAAWISVAATFVVVGLVAWAVGITLGIAPFDPILVFQVARVSIGAALGMAVGWCVAWWARRSRSRGQSVTPSRTRGIAVDA
jgi:hypothetical protein